MRKSGLGVFIWVSVLLASCGGGAPDVPGISEPAQLGELIFKDVSLSASGQMSCATCHDPSLGHASPFAGPVAFGGPNFPNDTSASASGLRLPPAIRYLKFNSAFRI
jgi:cytochrome c peroxidase